MPVIRAVGAAMAPSISTGRSGTSSNESAQGRGQVRDDDAVGDDPERPQSRRSNGESRLGPDRHRRGPATAPDPPRGSPGLVQRAVALQLDHADLWLVLDGRAVVALVDLRSPGSEAKWRPPTAVLELGEGEALFIPE